MKLENNNTEEAVTPLTTLEKGRISIDSTGTQKSRAFYEKFQQTPKTLKDMEFLTFLW